jgi:hypothetical protein
VIEGNDGVHHIKSGPEGAFGIVLTRHRRANQGHDLVADETCRWYPSYFCTTGTSQPKQALINSRTFSGSNFSESAVNPETSANTMVTSLRSSAVGARPVSNCANCSRNAVMAGSTTASPDYFSVIPNRQSPPTPFESGSPDQPWL